MALPFILPVLALVSFALAQHPSTTNTDSCGQNLPAYSPAHPPEVPLAVRGPYTGAWQSTAGGGTLNPVSAEFWPGNALGWDGIIQVDGISYEYLGVGSQSLPSTPNLKKDVPQTVSYDS